jgi:hypothetical protein
MPISKIVTNSIANGAVGATQTAATNQFYGFKNRIINGAMTIDQRNAGASVGTGSGISVYTVDRWMAIYSQTNKFTIQQDAGAVTPPVGFTDYLGITSSSAYTVGSSELFVITQRIEGFNIADLGWGTANAQTVTLSFWVRSSLTGTFGAALQNSAQDRSYPFTYTISSANTWEQKSVTIAGDTTGTWLTTNGIGIALALGLGVGSTFSGTAGSWAASNFIGATGATSVVGTSGATFYITGVQLEKGSTATSFDYRPYGTELALCQRYFETSFPQGTTHTNASTTAPNYNGTQLNSVSIYVSVSLKVEKRTTPTIVIYSSNSLGSPTPNQIQYFNNSGAGWTNTSGAVVVSLNSSSFIIASTNSATAGFSYWTAFSWATSSEL